MKVFKEMEKSDVFVPLSLHFSDVAERALKSVQLSRGQSNPGHSESLGLFHSSAQCPPI